MSFTERSAALPSPGIGISTEYGVAGRPGTTSIHDLAALHPRYAGFLEIGCSAQQGLDATTRAWVEQGGATSLHFLDLNLGEPDDFDPEWIRGMRRAITLAKPMWLCGDAGQWHFGRREPAHAFLQPPILSRACALEIASGVARLRELMGLEVFPENPPGAVFLGDMHLLEFFTQVCELADTGMVLDCAHLWMYQRATGRQPLAGFDDFCFDHVVELHIAGSELRHHEGTTFVVDEHGTQVFPATWAIFEHVVGRAKGLKAVVLEGERNTVEELKPIFDRVASIRDHSGRLPALGTT